MKLAQKLFKPWEFVKLKLLISMSETKFNLIYLLYKNEF